MQFSYAHTLGGVGWEPPPGGSHWDLLAINLNFNTMKSTYIAPKH